MWHWDQGRLAYFQFDAVRQMASYVVENDFKAASRDELLEATGLEFAAPETHSPWRNYARVLKLLLLISEKGGVARPTAIAELLATPGAATSDEYLHFLVSATTEPSPALRGWTPHRGPRYPLLFSLKYLLAKQAVGIGGPTLPDEVINAYAKSQFVGDEEEVEFAELALRANDFANQSVKQSDLRRQARESLKVIAQISYLALRRSQLGVSLAPEDASSVFHELHPVVGPWATEGNAEIRRRAELFRDGSTSDFFDYPNTTVSTEVESGFREGSKTKRTHITIERNGQLRKAYFDERPTTECDICGMDTAQAYPWVERVLDLHHLLPLSSGARVEKRDTTLDDLVPICPTCHRAVHRFYDDWLREQEQADFKDAKQAREVYEKIKTEFLGHQG